MLVNNVYFCGEKRASTQGNEVLKRRIFQQECSELLPGRVWQDVGKIELCELHTADGFDLIFKHRTWFIMVINTMQRYEFLSRKRHKILNIFGISADKC